MAGNWRAGETGADHRDLDASPGAAVRGDVPKATSLVEAAARRKNWKGREQQRDGGAIGGPPPRSGLSGRDRDGGTIYGL